MRQLRARHATRSVWYLYRWRWNKKASGLLLKFGIAVSGPVLIGKTMHFGGGLFICGMEEGDHA